MTVDTFYASTTNSGILSSSHATYSTARSGGTISLYTSSSVNAFEADQAFISPNYFCEEFALDFDTSSLPDGAVVTAAQFKMTHWFTAGSPTGTLEVRLYDYGTIAASDYVAGADLGSKTLLASLAVSAVSAGAQNTFTENGTNFQTSINLTGSTRVLIATDEVRLGTPTPTAQDIVYWRDPDDATQGNRPQLVVTYGLAATRDVTSAAALSVGAASDVASAAAASVDVTSSVTSAAALSVPVASDVTTAAAVSLQIVYLDVTSAAAISATYTSSVTSGAAIEATVTAAVTTAASIFVPVVMDVTSAAALYVSGMRSYRMGGGSVAGGRMPSGTVRGG